MLQVLQKLVEGKKMNNRKVDIVLISPPFSLKENFGLLDFVGQYGPPVNLLYLSSTLEKVGISTRLVDLSSETKNLEELAKYIVYIRPEFVGVAIHFSFLVNKSLNLIRLIKKFDPKVKIIVGGVHFTALPAKTMNECSEIDVGIIGEAEEAIVKVVKCLKEGRNLNNINGIIFRNKEKVIKVGDCNLIDDINKLPFPLFGKTDISLYSFALFKEKRNITFPITTSRGCLFACAFCDRAVLGRKIRFYSIDYLSELIEGLIKHFKVNSFDVQDENICITKNRFKDICELFKIMFLKYNITWHCSIRADSMNPDIAKTLYDSGCRSVTFGIESGSQRMLNIYNKKLNINEVPQKCKIVKDAGIVLAGSFIIGGPDEDENSISDTVNLVKRLNLDYMYLWYFVPFPGSPIYRDIETKGALVGNYSNMTGHEISFIPNTLSPEQLAVAYRKIYRTFYSRPSVILRIIMKNSFRGFPQLIKNGMKYLYRFVLK